MDKSNTIFQNLNQFSKKHNLEIFIDNLSKNIFYTIINSKNILHLLNTNKRLKKRIKSIINKKYNFRLQTNIDKNKYIFIIISLILSLIIQKDNYNNNLQNDSKVFDIIFLFLIKLYKNNLISFHYITIFFHLYLDLLEKKYTNIIQKVDKIMQILPFFKKILKIAILKNANNLDEKLLKSINVDIYEILRKIFLLNNSKNISNFKSIIYMRKKEKIFELLKFVYNYYNINIISENNKNFIKTNLINLYINNFSNENFNFLYNIYNKFLKNFNNKNNCKKSINNKISFMNGINEFFLDIYKAEINKAQKNEFYFDKYFIFDINEKNTGLTTNQIQFDASLYNGISIIFSFYAIRYNYTYNKSQVLLSFRNKENQEYLFKLLLIGNKLFIATYDSNEEVKSILFENFVYYSYNICILYYDQKINFIHFYLNKDTHAHKINLDIKNNSKIYVEVGYTNNGDHSINETFNGMIGPILIFNSNIDNKYQFELFQNILLNLKGKYYLIGEIFDKKSQKNDIENNYIFFNQIYYHTIDNNTLKLINRIQIELGKLLLYLNPDVVLNTLGFQKKNKFRDYQYYFTFSVNSQLLSKNKIYYYFNTEDFIIDFPKKEENLIYSFMNNRGFDLFSFNIEYMYNYLIILNNNYEEAIFALM